MRTILERAAVRGEVNLDQVSPRIAALPVDLLRHEQSHQRTRPRCRDPRNRRRGLLGPRLPRLRQRRHRPSPQRRRPGPGSQPAGDKRLTATTTATRGRTARVRVYGGGFQAEPSGRGIADERDSPSGPADNRPVQRIAHMEQPPDQGSRPAPASSWSASHPQPGGPSPARPEPGQPRQRQPETAPPAPLRRATPRPGPPAAPPLIRRFVLSRSSRATCTGLMSCSHIAAAASRTTPAAPSLQRSGDHHREDLIHPRAGRPPPRITQARRL